MITLKTLEDATEQEVFDQVAQHLLTQKVKSMNPEGICAYRGGDDLKCAAGCLIADDEFDPYVENICWGDLVEVGQVPAAHRTLITELQRIHDHKDPSVWYAALFLLSLQWKLNWNFNDYLENSGLEWKFE